MFHDLLWYVLGLHVLKRVLGRGLGPLVEGWGGTEVAGMLCLPNLEGTSPTLSNLSKGFHFSINNYICYHHVQQRRGEFIPHPTWGGVGVTRLVLGDPKVVSKPRYILEQLVWQRANALLTYLACYHEWKEQANLSTSGGSCMFQKWKLWSIWSTHVVSWQSSFWLRMRIKHCRLDSHPFKTTFSRIVRVWSLT